MTTKRILFDVNGVDVENLQAALRLTDSLAAEENVREATLVVPVLGNLTGAVVNAFGSRFVDRLVQRRGVRLSNGGWLALETVRTRSYGFSARGILAIFPTRKLLDLIDAVYGLSFVVVVPWLAQDIEAWRRTWNPEIPGQGRAAEVPLVRSELLESGLQLLTRNVDPSAGLARAHEKESAESLLWQLHRAGEWASPETIRAWAVRSGWTPESADRLQAVAEKMEKRKSPPRGPYRADLLDYLRSLRDSGSSSS